MEDAAWDALCVDPHQASLERGREQGKAAGLAAGFKDGQAVGIVKGVEYGMELGFIRGSLLVVMDSLSRSPEAFGDPVHRERISKTASTLSDLLNAFPKPDQVFGEYNKNWLGVRDSASPVASATDQEYNDSEEPVSQNPSDLLGQVQLIRSKFKLLTVQLKWTNFSLKKLMDDAAVAPAEIIPGQPQSSTTTTESKQDPSDW